MVNVKSIMIICKNCGVELEPDMSLCPLCEEPVTSGSDQTMAELNFHEKFNSEEQIKPGNRIQRKAAWKLIVFILILSSIITSSLNIILNKEISWSQYPVAVCMIVFSYISFFTFLNTRKELKYLFGFVSSSVLILLLDLITGGQNWSLRLAIPLLLLINLVIIVFLEIIRFSKKRGVNLIAYSFLAAAMLCIGTEIVIDFYIKDKVNLIWSLIVSACVLPISLVLLFMYFRLKKGNDLNKTFHI